MHLEEVKSRMLQFYKETKLNPWEVAIGAGAALLYHGLREEANDIDISIPKKRFEKYRDQGNFPKDSYVVPYDEAIDLHVRENMVGSVQTIWGSFYSLEEIIDQKETLLKLPHRSPEKKAQDKKDIEAAKKKLKTILERW